MSMMCLVDLLDLPQKPFVEYALLWFNVVCLFVWEIVLGILLYYPFMWRGPGGKLGKSAPCQTTARDMLGHHTIRQEYAHRVY
jgi:hypothetical protein